MRRRWLFVAAAAGLSACAPASQLGVPHRAVPLSGEWGGTHVALKLGPASGTLEYDCAAGTIDGPVVPRADGSFQAYGRHTPGSGGPDREGEVRPSYATRYSGSVRGTRMTLEGRVENGVLLGPFALVRGAEPIIFRCL